MILSFEEFAELNKLNSTDLLDRLIAAKDRLVCAEVDYANTGSSIDNRNRWAAADEYYALYDVMTARLTSLDQMKFKQMINAWPPHPRSPYSPKKE